MKKMIRRMTAVTAALLAAALLCSPLYALGSGTTADGITAAVYDLGLQFDRECKRVGTYIFDGPEARRPDPDVSGLPPKADLRDMDGKNYVSEVKQQAPWGTCWSFGATTAAETSIAYDLGHDYSGTESNDAFDLSELHLAWFAYTALPEDCTEYPSQGGEGYYPIIEETDDPSDISLKKLNIGGIVNYAATLYAAGMGPALETEIPYGKISDVDYTKTRLVAAVISEEGIIDADSFVNETYRAETTDNEALRAEWTGKGFEETDAETGNDILLHKRVFPDTPFEAAKGKKVFALIREENAGDWTVDESKRFLSHYRMKDANILPYPALEDRNGAYVFNRAGVDAIRSEIARGRIVAASFSGDYAEPGLKPPAGVVPKMNFLDTDGNPTDDPKAAIWAQYTFDDTYDPSDPESVNKWISPVHAICIVGYDDNFPKEYFNDPNGTIGGNGAFLVRNTEGSSDNSNPRAVNDWGNGGSGYFWMSYYDQSLVYCESFDFDTDEATRDIPVRISMYDFLPDKRQLSVDFEEEVRMANVFEAKDDCVVRYAGFETAHAETDVEYSVYLLHAGAKSPVDGTLIAERTVHYTYAGYHTADLGETARIPAGSRYSIVVCASSEGKNELSIAVDLNRNGISFYNKEKTGYYAKTVVNPGESFVGSGDEWTDWKEIIRRLETMNMELNNNGFDYDNFPIRAYTQSE